MTIDRDHNDFEPFHASTPTSHVLTELQLYGYRPFQDEPDPRPLPEAGLISGAVAEIFDALASTLRDTRLEPDLDDLLWSTVNLFHRAISRVQRALDDNEAAQKCSQNEQDGSEIRSVELERLIAKGLTLVERRDSMELFRDQAADQYESHAGSSWRPRAGSKVNHRAIWDRLDKVHAKHPHMVLLHGGSPKGAERIAACWADHRKVLQIAFKPDWARHAKAAPFKRNDQMLQAMPIGVIVFPGTGISANLADKARAMGIPVWRLKNDGT